MRRSTRVLLLAAMWVREAIGGVPVPGSEQVAGTCVRLAVMNTLYDNVAKNGSWVPHTVDGQLCVASLDIAELAGGGCTEITNSLTVKYTAAHPNLGTFSIAMTGPGGPYTFTPGAGGTSVNRLERRPTISTSPIFQTRTSSSCQSICCLPPATRPTRSGTRSHSARTQTPKLGVGAASVAALLTR
jgi:hypothetical protein